MIIELLVTAAFTVCWQPPTENVDGTDIVGPLAYAMHYGPSSRTYDSVVDIAAGAADPHPTDPDALCETRDDVAAGQYYVALTAIDQNGDESDYSNEVIVTASDPVVPMPPVILEEDEVVFTVIKQPDRFVLLPVGTVPAGTPCDMNEAVKGHGVVPNSAVVWTSATGSRPIVVVAQCNG